MERKRVFIALPAGDPLKQAVEGFRRTHAGLDVRWIPSPNLHVTMVPPWAPEHLQPVCRVLEGIASATAPVPVRFDSVSAGPDPRRPRLLWATGTAPEALLTLALQLGATFGGGSMASREFLLHLTIARLRRQGSDSPALPVLREEAAWEGLLDTLCLYESILNPSGAEYRVLCRFPLSGGL